MKILVTGGAGYLGSVLLPKLLARGHEVRVLDVGYFGLGHLRALRPQVELVREDLRRLADEPEFVEGLLREQDCIIHLAAISNDPSAELNPELTHEVNFRGTEVLARAARRRGIKFLFSSSCSVYGAASGPIDEDGAVRPLSAYAVSKVRAEELLVELADASWKPVILRNGTLFGYSPRMRFDLVANIFALQGTLNNEIRVFGDGTQWRPFLHVSDCARAFVYFSERVEPRYIRYNVAHQNARVIDLANTFASINPLVQIVHLDTREPDERDYSVLTERMQEEGFSTRVSPEVGIEEMVDAIISGLIPDPESIYYRNAKWLKELSQIGDKNHRDLVHLMESLATIRQPRVAEAL